jgi:hypothetical protein
MALCDGAHAPTDPLPPAPAPPPTHKHNAITTPNRSIHPRTACIPKRTHHHTQKFHTKQLETQSQRQSRMKHPTSMYESICVYHFILKAKPW